MKKKKKILNENNKESKIITKQTNLSIKTNHSSNIQSSPLSLRKEIVTSPDSPPLPQKRSSVSPLPTRRSETTTKSDLKKPSSPPTPVDEKKRSK